MYKSSPIAMTSQTQAYAYASSCASNSSSDSSPSSSTSSRASDAFPHASARNPTFSGLDIFSGQSISDFSSSSLSWPQSNTLYSPPATAATTASSRTSSSSLSSITSSSSGTLRVSSYISDEDLLGLDDDDCVPYLSEAPAPPRLAHEWQQQFLQPQLQQQQPMVIAEPSHQPLPVLVARPKIKRTVSGKKGLHRSKTSRHLPSIKEAAM